jgi:TPR repeat protein
MGSWCRRATYGVNQDYTQARQWYEKATAAGDTRALSELGKLFHKGDGVSQDYTQARQWYEKALGAGDKEALYLLGRHAYHSKDYQQAVQWHQKAVAVGNADSMLSLGLLYAKGLGVQQDDAQAGQMVLKGCRHRQCGRDVQSRAHVQRA